MNPERAEFSVHDAASLRALIEEAILRVMQHRRSEGDLAYSFIAIRDQVIRMRESRAVELSQNSILDDEIARLLDVLSKFISLNK